MPGKPEFTNKYFNMSQGPGDMQGPWNTTPEFERIDDREQQAAVDGGDGLAAVQVSRTEKQAVTQAAMRTASRTDADPLTGAELGGKHSAKPA